ncbi:hypothetical protein OIU85_024116 [Salix viminalis]|uniref:DUF7731 domain-containing protein n=1 Tax=Salix viminalis TaxID=40686 RepID=A0A9Q0U061_SALVM|nr:hypothetical protein OIU85_024116 [Salix viminalis]
MAHAITFRLWFLSASLVGVSIFCCSPGNASEVGPQTGTGIVDADPAEVVAKALLCFNNKYIYSSCENAYRLTETGNLNLPPQYVDPYCSGPMFETRSRQDVAMVPERGNFDVSEHLQAENNNACNSASQILLGLGFMFAGPALFALIVIMISAICGWKSLTFRGMSPS